MQPCAQSGDTFDDCACAVHTAVIWRARNETCQISGIWTLGGPVWAHFLVHIANNCRQKCPYRRYLACFRWRVHTANICMYLLRCRMPRRWTRPCGGCAGIGRGSCLELKWGLHSGERGRGRMRMRVRARARAEVRARARIRTRVRVRARTGTDAGACASASTDADANASTNANADANEDANAHTDANRDANGPRERGC